MTQCPQLSEGFLYSFTAFEKNAEVKALSKRLIANGKTPMLTGIAVANKLEMET